ncbi:MAG TPA: GNAT family N-acetyltransferase [Phytomonospora sp.]
MPDSAITVERIPELGPERFAEITGGLADPFETDGLGLQWAEKPVHYVARADGRLVAHAGLVDVPLTVGGEDHVVGGLGTVIVSPTMRGRGLARLVVGAVMDHARAEGRDFGLLFCLESRVGLYTRLGWTLVDGEVTARQPAGDVVMPIRTMRITLRDDAAWPDGPVRLRSLPM